MSRITNYLAGAFLLFLLFSCENDNNNKTEKNDSLNQLKEELHLDRFGNVNIAENTEVNWNTNLKTKNKDVEILEVDVKEKFPSNLQSNFFQPEMNYQLISIESQGELKNYFVEIFSYNDSDAYSKSITKLNKFRGVLNVFLLNGQNLGSISIDHGNARNISESNALEFLAETINSFYTSSNITKKIPLCDGTYTQVVEQSQDRWRVVSLNGKILSVEYMDTKVTRTTTILPYPCDGSGDRDAIILQRMAHYYTGDGRSYSGVVDLLATIITDPSFSNNPCLVAVFTKIGGSPTFQTYLKRFDSEFSVANLKLTAGSVGMEGSYGRTLMPKNSEVEIVFNDKELGRPALDIAKTFMHEMIHAEIFRQLLNLAKTNGAIDVNEISRLAELPNDNQVLEYYWKYRNGKQDAAHELMSAKYIDVMVSFLKEVDKSLTQKQYEALAWQGLKETSAWNEKDPNEKYELQYTYDKWKRESSNGCN